MAKHAISSASVPELAGRLPPFPRVILQLLDCLHEEDFSLDDLVRIARTDSVIASATLSAANRLRRIRAMPDTADLFAAASLIGTQKVRQIVVSHGLNRFLSEGGGQAVLHDHSRAVAIVASELALLVNVSVDEAYMAGILHDVGQLAFQTVDPALFAEIRRQAVAADNLLALEAETFGLDHCEIGLLLGTYWRLPQNILLAIGAHHDSGTDWKSKLHAILNLAETICRGLDIPPSPHNRVSRVNASALDYLGLRWDSAEMHELFARSRARFRIFQSE